MFLTPYLQQILGININFPNWPFLRTVLNSSMIGPTILQGPHHAPKIYHYWFIWFQNYFFKVASVIANAIISLFNVYRFVKYACTEVKN
jgi:hypothetical protein